MSCASFIHAADRPVHLSKSSRAHYDPAEEHAALIGLQALSLNLETANRSSEELRSSKKIQKPLKISTSRKTPEKHVSISPLPATPRSSSSALTPRGRPSPCRSDSSGFQSLASPGSVGSGSETRLFTNHSNFEVKTSDSTDSLNTRSSVASGRQSRQIRSRSRQSTPQPRQTTPQPRQTTPQPRQTTPQPRQTTPLPRQDSHSDVGKLPEETLSVFAVQNLLKKGEVVEGVLRFDRRSFEHAYIRAPVNIDRADGHLKWRSEQ